MAVSSFWILQPQSGFPGESWVRRAGVLLASNHWTTWSVLNLYLPFLLYCQWMCLVHADFLSSTLLLLQGSLGLWNEHWTFKTVFGIRVRARLTLSVPVCFPTTQIKKIWINDVARFLSEQNSIAILCAQHNKLALSIKGCIFSVKLSWSSYYLIEIGCKWMRVFRMWRQHCEVHV